MKKYLLIGLIIAVSFLLFWTSDAQVLNLVRPSQIATSTGGAQVDYCLTVGTTSSIWKTCGGSGSSDAGWGTTTINGIQGTLTGGFLNFTFATGTAGSDFHIASSSGSTFTFNIPDAGASARGFVSTSTQTFTGVKTFLSDVVVSVGTGTSTIKADGSGINFQGEGNGFSWNGNAYITGNDSSGDGLVDYLELAALSTTSTLQLFNQDTSVSAVFDISQINTSNKTFTFPNITGTFVVSTSTFTPGDLLYYTGTRWNRIPPNESTTTIKFLSQFSSSTPGWQTVPQAGTYTFFLQQTSSTLQAYKALGSATSTLSSTAVTSITASTTVAAWLTATTSPSLTNIPSGIWTVHFDATKDGGTKNIQFYADVFRYSTGNVETLIASTSLSQIITGIDALDPERIDVNFYSNALVINSTDRLGIRIVAVPSGIGTDPSGSVYYQGVADSFLELPANTVDATNFVPYSGATADLNLGSRNLLTSSSIIFDGEIQPDGATCADGEILKKTGANNWDCATDAQGSGTFTTTTINGVSDVTFTFATSTGSGGSLYITTSSQTVTFNIGTTTVRASMLSSLTFPDTTGEAYYESIDLLGTNDSFGYGSWRFGTSTSAALSIKAGIGDRFSIPSDFKSEGAQIVALFNTTSTSGVVVWDFDYRCVAVGESLDQSGYQESVSVSSTVPGTIYLMGETVLPITSSNCTAGDIMQFKFSRDGVDASDTLLGPPLLHDLLFEYKK